MNLLEKVIGGIKSFDKFVLCQIFFMHSYVATCSS